jgi:hypothetical protein
MIRTGRYVARERSIEELLCSCKQTIARYEVVEPDGTVIGLYCSTCAEQVADDLNAGLESDAGHVAHTLPEEA